MAQQLEPMPQQSQSMAQIQQGPFHLLGANIPPPPSDTST